MLRADAESLSIDGPEAGDWWVEVFGINGSGGLVHIDITQTAAAATGGVAVVDASVDRGVAPTAVEFNVKASGAGIGTITSYQWDFGDCSPIAAESNPTHVFGKAGKFLVSVKTSDFAGNSNTGLQKILVTAVDQPPMPMFTSATLDGAMPTNVTLDARPSYDVDGRITKYVWNFGDGETGTGNLVAHEYLKWGSYRVTLSLVDNDGLSSSTCQVVTTGEAPGLPPVPCST